MWRQSCAKSGRELAEVGTSELARAPSYPNNYQKPLGPEIQRCHGESDMHTERERKRKQRSGQSPGPRRMQAHEGVGWSAGKKEESLEVNVLEV